MGAAVARRAAAPRVAVRLTILAFGPYDAAAVEALFHMTGLLIVALVLTAAVLWYGLLAWQRILHRRDEQQAGTAQARADRPDADPDAPAPLPAVATWLAVRSGDSDAVMRALGLRTVLPANWRAGLVMAARAGVFVTPPVGGWVLAVGADLDGIGEPAEAVPPLLTLLSRMFGRAAWFCRDDGGERYGWAVAERGALLRGYAYADGEGHRFWHGDVTDDERALGCFVDDPRDHSDDDVKWWPDARLVTALAARWSLDPARLAAPGAPPSVGWVGRR